MTHPPTTAAERLAAILEQENIALRSADMAAAAALLNEKQDAAAGFAIATAGAPPPAELARRLRALAEDNRRLLEQAIAVQGRVIELVAGAIRQAAAPPRYAPGGAIAPERRAAPLTLSARA